MALLYRAHFGFNTMRLANAAGEDTSVAYGLVGTLLNLLELAPPPTHLAVVFDAAGKTFRCVASGAAQAPCGFEFCSGRGAFEHALRILYQCIAARALCLGSRCSLL